MSELKVNVFTARTISLIVLAVYVVYIFGVFKFLGGRFIAHRNHALEGIIALHFLCFLVFYVWFPTKFTIKKGLILCVVIPLLCCAILYTTCNFVNFIFTGKLPFLHRESIGDMVLVFVGANGIVGYVMFGMWFVHLPLLVIYIIFMCFSRSPGYTEILKERVFIQQKNKVRFFAHGKFTLIVGMIYFVCAIALGFFEKLHNNEYYADTFFSGSLIYLFSFISILHVAPFIVGNTRKIISYCLIIPVLWPVLIYIFYALLILLYTSGTPYFQEDIFTFRFYLDSYVETCAWFISLPLLLVCCAYARLVKSERGRRVWRRRVAGR